MFKCESCSSKIIAMHSVKVCCEIFCDEDVIRCCDKGCDKVLWWDVVIRCCESFVS